MLPLLPLALLVADTPPRNMTVEQLDDGSYRLTVVYSAHANVELHARMQLRLMEHAERLCRGRGRAVSAGTLEVNQAPRGRIALSEVYSCQSR